MAGRAEIRFPLTDVEVEPAVEIVISEGGAEAHVHSMRRDIGAAKERFLAEVAAAVIDKEIVPRIHRVALEPDGGQEEIQISVVVDVAESRAVRTK